MRKIAVVYTPSPEIACAVIRLFGPLEAAQWDVRATWTADADTDTEAKHISGADIVIVQREFPGMCKELYSDILQKCRAEGKPVVYETDDLLFDVPVDHVGHMYHSQFRDVLMEAARNADCVTVSTQALKQQLSHLNPRIEVIANYLNDSIWKLRIPAEPAPGVPLIIGYCGTQTHKQDLDLVAPVLASILRAYKGQVQLKFWGIAPPNALRGVGGVSWDPMIVHGYSAFADYILQQHCDIFLAPLQDSIFNRCKSAIKFLEYAALGVAGIYSKITPYEEVVDHGKTGLLASSIEEWEECIKLLIEDSDLRLSIARQSQEALTQNWLLSKEFGKTIRVYDSLIATAVG
jgi:glycosyltransferase involved in cell wall biosynthesis